MAEDSPAPPLPRRVPAGDRQMPGGRQGPDPGPVRPAVLSEDVLRRIRDALNSMEHDAPPEAPPAPAGRPAPLPRRVPGAAKGPKPPAVIARPRLPFPPRLLPPALAGETADDLPALSFTAAGGVTEEIAGRRPEARTEEISGRPEARTEEISGRPEAGTEEISGRPKARTEEISGRPMKIAGRAGARTEEIPGRPDARTEQIAGRPGATTEQIAGRPDAGTEEIAGRPPRAPQPGEADLPDQHDHTGGETSPPRKAPGQQRNGRARRAKRPARRAKVPGTAAKPAPRKAPAFPGETTVQMAPLFPDEPPPAEAAPHPPALSWPQRAPWGRRILWLLLVLVLVSAGSLALLLAR